MKPKYLLNSFTRKFYIENLNENNIKPLIQFRFSSNEDDKEKKCPQDHMILRTSSSMNRIIYNKAFTNKSNNYQKLNNDSKIINDYFNERHMNTVRKINKMKNAKFDNEMNSLREKPTINNLSSKIANKKKFSNYYWNNMDESYNPQKIKYININQGDNLNAIHTNRKEMRKNDLNDFINYANNFDHS